jgi:hypothetical protein
MAHFASRDIFHNHSVREPEISREIVTDRRDRYLFFVYTQLVLRDIIAQCDPARLIIVRLFLSGVRTSKERRLKKKPGRVASIRMTSCALTALHGISQLVFDSLIRSTCISVGSANQSQC